MKTITRLFLLIFLLISASPVFAQSAEYQLHLRRLFGYGNGADVSGTFSLSLVGNADNIQSVTYLIDGQQMAVLDQAPFSLTFKTTDYPSGGHKLTGVVKTKDGREVTTQAVGANFLTAEQQGQSFTKIIFPLIAVILVIAVIGIVSQFLLMRNPKRMAPGAPRTYGLKGGTICPRCGRAYPIHFWSLNLIVGALDRCDYCGKVAIVHARPRAELDAAVQAELTAAQTGESSLPGAEGAQTEEEKLKKLLDESRYQE